ncbi:hypothetical protein [Paenibacillus sp. FSL P2-0173]|uniref:hypothetical protein n=1 Tax=Paenibacillus sp. FSL P2-0173 TaxID=2921627 RepID=UPI0030F95C0B
MNVNSYVEVVLTKTGIDILENHYMKLYSHLPINIRMPLDMHFKISKQEPVQFQLWELMQIYGPHILRGAPYVPEGYAALSIRPANIPLEALIYD